MSAANGDTIIELKGVSKTYTRGKEDVHVLDNLDLTVRKGAFEAFMGPSGSGKSTLLNLIGGVDHASAGSVRVAGQELTRMGDGELAKFRSSNLGFIFQQYNLLPVLNAQDNVELPLLLTSLGSGERKKRAQTALRVVGLDDRMTHFPRQLSGGQEQRVAIARAIVSPVVRSSAWRSRARSSTTRRSSSPTSPPAISIARARTRSSRCWRRSTKSSARPS
jgi:putative ABC transport system ATP-binding protein